MADKRRPGGVSYQAAGKDYFEKRQLRRHAGAFSLWALGVGAVISGDFSGWNWYTLAILYFAAYGRDTLVYSPEEEFAIRQRDPGLH